MKEMTYGEFEEACRKLEIPPIYALACYRIFMGQSPFNSNCPSCGDRGCYIGAKKEYQCSCGTKWLAQWPDRREIGKTNEPTSCPYCGKEWKVLYRKPYHRATHYCRALEVDIVTGEYHDKQKLIDRLNQRN